MTRFELFKQKDIDELSQWIDLHGQFDGSPWIKWFDKNYCNNCEPIPCHYVDSKNEILCSYCELHNKCKFLEDLLSEPPNNKQLIKMWLETEADENE